MSNRKQYDADLADLHGVLAEMGRSVADAVANSLAALSAEDAEEAEKIVQGDVQINAMERDIEHRCVTLLLRQQPVAGDLRWITAAYKVITDLERIGDHAADIAEIAPQMFSARRAGDPALDRTIEMGQKAHALIGAAVSAFLLEDEAAARAVIDADDEVDFAFDGIKQLLGAEIAADPTTVNSALEVLMAAKYIERIADHAVNLAERVSFVRTGRYKNEDMF